MAFGLSYFLWNRLRIMWKCLVDKLASHTTCLTFHRFSSVSISEVCLFSDGISINCWFTECVMDLYLPLSYHMYTTLHFHSAHLLYIFNSSLYYVRKIPKQHSWISTSLHVTKLLVTLNTYVEPGTKSNWDYMNYLVTFFLCLVLTCIAFFETTSEITSDKVCLNTIMLKV